MAGQPAAQRDLAERGSRLTVSLLLIPVILGINHIYDSLNHGPHRLFLETPGGLVLAAVTSFFVMRATRAA